MNKFLLSALAAVAVMSITSCSSDNEPSVSNKVTYVSSISLYNNNPEYTSTGLGITNQTSLIADKAKTMCEELSKDYTVSKTYEWMSYEPLEDQAKYDELFLSEARADRVEADIDAKIAELDSYINSRDFGSGIIHIGFTFSAKVKDTDQLLSEISKNSIGYARTRAAMNTEDAPGHFDSNVCTCSVKDYCDAVSSSIVNATIDFEQFWAVNKDYSYANVNFDIDKCSVDFAAQTITFAVDDYTKLKDVVYIIFRGYIHNKNANPGLASYFLVYVN